MTNTNYQEAKLVLKDGIQKYGYIEEKSIEKEHLSFIPFGRSKSIGFNLEEFIPMRNVLSIDLSIR